MADPDDYKYTVDLIFTLKDKLEIEFNIEE